MSSKEFNPELLAMYYERLFPYQQFADWLSYNQGEDFLHKREFSFTLENDTYIRYKSFRNAEEMKEAMTKNQPHKVDLGAVFSISPEDKDKVNGSAFNPEERELVFDIDLTDYDDIRTCCQGANICHKCWNLMIAAVKVMDIALREDFGFKSILWVYSGRRGIHCWVADEIARHLTNAARSSVVQYFTVVEGNEKSKRKAVLKEPLHPSLSRANAILEPLFHKYILSEDGLNVLGSQDSWSVLLDMIPDERIANDLNSSWSSVACDLKPEEKWNELSGMVKKVVAANSSSKKRPIKSEDKKKYFGLRTCINEIICAYLYPRLDANVSKQRNHLLKIPFAVHPKTGRVCVPINVSKLENFNPFEVPTLVQLENDINDTQSISSNGTTGTSLDEYIAYFENTFLKNVKKQLLVKQRDTTERAAAESGNW